MTPKLDDHLLQQAVDKLVECGGNKQRAADALGMSRTTLVGRLNQAERRHIRPHVSVPPPAPDAPKAAPVDPAIERLLGRLKREPLKLEQIAEFLGRTRGQALDVMDQLEASGAHIHKAGDTYQISAVIAPAFTTAADLPTYVSRPDGTYYFGALGDNHLCSKYARLEVLNELYDLYQREGVDRVFNTGNWIDGEARFNVHDLLIHGMDEQLAYLAAHYPHREGLTTYAVSGDDHEGWYAQRFGVDIGRRAQQSMREVGRTDWVDLGYMEAHIRLVHAQTGKEAILAVVHPGGGSAYALSYSIQKIIEALDGGEKPAVGLYGHYHKLWAGNIRNVWCVQTGTTEDQTPFMRKQKIQAHVGGTLIRLHQDPESGAITRCMPEMVRYFNKGFYNQRWNHGGGINPAERSIVA